MKILVLNSGSSSQKSALFELDPGAAGDPVPPLWEGKIEWDGDKEDVRIRDRAGREIHRQQGAGVHRASVAALLENLWSGPTAILKSASEIAVVGHRVVHGGPKLTQPVYITSEVKRDIESVAAIAPLHNQAALQGIELIEEMLPTAPQIAVFDTGFHSTLPKEAFVYPVPYAWYEREGIRRYGFHGINHEYCAQRVAHLLHRDPVLLKIVSCHLGNGCSLAAIQGGKSVDTTMGFTPLEGLMMGTRSGSIDPGILIHMLRGNRHDMSPDSLDHALNQQSGLLGVSGVSSDMRDVLQAAGQGNQRARLALDIFIHRLQAGVGAMAAALGGLDALVFTAGIGENSPEVRQAACAKMGFLGIQLDNMRNSAASADQDISSDGSPARVFVIRAQEDWAIARQCAKMG